MTLILLEIKYVSLAHSLIIKMMNKTNSEPIDGSKQQLPETYLDLIEKVGGKGKYQYIYTVIQAFSYYVTGIVLMSTAFIFYNPEFDCQAFGLITDDCYATVCSLPRDQWAGFVTEQANSYKSLANAFGAYHCDDQVYLNLYASTPYLGTMIGCFFIAILADNIGRKAALILGCWLTVLGCIILIFAQSLWMASVGLILCGMGSDSLYGTLLCLAAECVNDNFRQRISSIVQAFFIVGALFVTLFYYLFEDWKISTIYCLFIPSVICAFVITFYIKESPMYLAIQGAQKLLKEINDIGWINKKQKDIVKMQDVEHVMKLQQTIKYNKASSPWDVFRYASLRPITFAQALIGMCTSLMYYGPSLIVGQFGFDIYTSQTAINIADLLTYYPLMLFIDKVNRRTCGSILFGLATIISILLIFVVKPSNCDMCPTVFIQLALVFAFRFVISMEFTLFLIYQTQLYPIRVRNISGGVLSIFSTASSTLSPIVMGAFTRAEISPFILFTVMGIVAIGCYMACPQTYGKLCPEEIQEIAYEKHQNQIKNSGVDGQKLHKQ